MRRVSKSKLLSFRQCPKKLWLEDHQPELNVERAGTGASFVAGHSVGTVARRLYDPTGSGELVNVARIGYEESFRRTRELLESAQPIFEAGFAGEGAIAFADVMLPVERSTRLAHGRGEVGGGGQGIPSG